MVDQVRDGGGSSGFYSTERPGALGRTEPGSATHTILPNRHAQVTPEVGPTMFAIPSVAGRRGAGELIGAQHAGGEVVLGTDAVVTPRTNAEWILGLNERWYGRGGTGAI